MTSLSPPLGPSRSPSSIVPNNQATSFPSGTLQGRGFEYIQIQGVDPQEDGSLQPFAEIFPINKLIGKGNFFAFYAASSLKFPLPEWSFTSQNGEKKTCLICDLSRLPFATKEAISAFAEQGNVNRKLKNEQDYFNFCLFAAEKGYIRNYLQAHGSFITSQSAEFLASLETPGILWRAIPPEVKKACLQIKIQDKNRAELDLRNFEKLVDDQILSSLSSKNLQSLNLKECITITDEGIASLAKGCPNLQSLNLESCDKITSRGLASLANGCPNLQSLNLLWCKKITNKGVTSLAMRCKGLQSLTLAGCVEITDEGIASLAICKSLQFLDLAGRNDITDKGIVALASGCPNLQSLNLEQCDEVTDKGLFSLASGCPNLQSLNLRECDITDSGVAALASNCKGLRSLDLAGCDKITDNGVAALASNCKDLRSLDLKWCKKITPAGLALLPKTCNISY